MITGPSASSLLVKMAKDSGKPIINEFELYLFGRKLFRDRGYKDEKLPHANRELTPIRARKLLSAATEHPDWLSNDGKLLRPDRDFVSGIYYLNPADAVDVAMIADPFCYLSHASALAWHGLTEASELHISTPSRPEWKRRIAAYMSNMLEFDVAQAEYDDLPFEFSAPRFKNELRGRQLYRHELSKTASPILSPDGVRVASIGDAFLQSIEAPSWCGGINQVIDIWKCHARAFQDDIISAVDNTAEKIAKVRAGYLLSEGLGITNSKVDAWVNDAQRGSSRKLDPGAPYQNRFSARWMLSINVEDSTLPSQSQ